MVQQLTEKAIQHGLQLDFIFSWTQFPRPSNEECDEAVRREPAAVAKLTGGTES
jgi:hypothetical protein